MVQKGTVPRNTRGGHFYDITYVEEEMLEGAQILVQGS